MSSVDKKLNAFLLAGGAEIIDVTNQWEVARFKTQNGICVIYRNAKGRVSFSNGEATEAYEAYLSKKPWSILTKKKRTARNEVEELLLARDGRDCFYCGKDMPEGERTLEHILSIVHGGTNHPANLVLSCKPCNKAADSLPIVQKISLRDDLRAIAGGN